MWNYYLLSCAASFRARDSQLWQIVLSKKGVAGGYIRPILKENAVENYRRGSCLSNLRLHYFSPLSLRERSPMSFAKKRDRGDLSY